VSLLPSNQVSLSCDVSAHTNTLLDMHFMGFSHIASLVILDPA